jgi:ribosomal protein L11 methyltransferase
MAYVALRFDAAAAYADTWSDALLEAGALCVDLSDPGAGTDTETPLYGEPGETPASAWPWSRVVALFAAGADPPEALAAAAAAIGQPVPAYETHGVPEEDWVRRTQAQFGPIAIAPGFWIVPSWSAPVEADALTLRLDPGLAFGTGAHPTTRLCLEWLHAHVEGGERVLDYGCGSGILAIAARKLGAGAVYGTDIDPQAMNASRANARRNEVDATFATPDRLPPDAHDILIANILANPLVILAPALAARVRVGGAIALSGILAGQAQDVAAAYARWFTLAPWRAHDGWVLLAGVRTG